MTIKRQYSLPNCRLLLEGITADEVVMEGDTTRPLMTVVVHTECSFASGQHQLSGGRAFLENLAQAVSAYAQEFLSGVRHPLPTANPDGEAVTLERATSGDLHHLRCYPKANQGEGVQPLQIDLTTVQLFDLVEAVDQFFADTRTLPELTLQLAPAGRRYRQADVPATQRSAPVALGISGLAIAALALFLLPVPGPLEAPERRLGDPAGETATEPEETDADTTEAEERPQGPRLSLEELEASLAAAQPILDPTELDFIQRYTRRQLEAEWQNRGAVTQDLAYRISVGRDGALLAYEAVAGTPATAAEQTPLPSLRFQPTQDAPPEAVAEFRVVFTRNGVLQINPWAGYQGTPTLGPQIEDAATLTSLGEALGATLRERWQADPDLLGDELVYRVGVTADGAIADYAARNAVAFELEPSTPLPDLYDPAAAGIGEGTVIPQQPLGHFTVTFYKDGRVEVGPF